MIIVDTAAVLLKYQYSEAFHCYAKMLLLHILLSLHSALKGTNSNCPIAGHVE